MSAMWWMKWFGIGLLAVIVSLTTTGCSGDDDEEGGGTTVVTNTVVIVTNAPADGAEAEADDPNPDQPVEQEVPPQPIEPEDGKVIRSLLADIGVPVTFRWGAVPGAVGYRLEVNGARYDRDNQQITLNFRGSPVPYTWFVRAFRPDMTLGPPSETFSFSILRQ